MNLVTSFSDQACILIWSERQVRRMKRIGALKIEKLSILIYISLRSTSDIRHRFNFHCNKFFNSVMKNEECSFKDSYNGMLHFQ